MMLARIQVLKLFSVELSRSAKTRLIYYRSICCIYTQSLFGQFPAYMLDTGRDAAKYFTAKGAVFERPDGDDFVRCGFFDLELEV